MPASVLQAFYLASSWLWCIGAFLPVLLLRDYGWVTLAGFTLANVIGAAAFGWVITHKMQPVFLAAHKPFLKLFSHVTIAFQLFFIAWLSALVGPWLLLAMLVLVVFFYRSERVIGEVAVGLFLVSMILFGIYFANAPPLVKLSVQPGWWHTLLPLILGFALSPYLDLTFHRALTKSPNPRLSFTLGFGVFFLSLLVFVFVYSEELRGMAAGGSIDLRVLWPVVAFMVMQTAFTVAVHLREVQRYQPVSMLSLVWPYGFYLLVLFATLYIMVSMTVPWLELPVTEVLYKGFLLFYGLVFPLYLLLGKNRHYFWGALVLTVFPYSLGFLLGTGALVLLSLSMAIVVAFVLVYFVGTGRLMRNCKGGISG